MKKLLIIYHTQGGNTGAMADAVRRGANHEDISVDVRFVSAGRAGTYDLKWCDGLILGTPENFGYMSGAIKDFLDRTFYPLEGKLEGLPYAMFVSASNDGTGAVNSIRRIANGFPLKEVQPPVICRGELSEQDIVLCEELGMGLAAGLEAGIF